MENSWIKLTRGIEDHWIYQNPSYFKAWVCILLNVNFKDAKVLIEGDLYECKRGESLYSIETWVEKFGHGWTYQKVRTFFKKLQSDEMLIVEGMRKTTKISVCNYDTYQNEQQAGNKQVTNSQQAGNKQVTTREERKERKEGKEGKEALYPFDDWWCAYGKKVNRKKAEAKWGRLKEAEKAKCMVVVKTYVQSTPEVKYRKDPITYLNNESWNDDLTTTQGEMTVDEVLDTNDAFAIMAKVKKDLGL